MFLEDFIDAQKFKDVYGREGRQTLSFQRRDSSSCFADLFIFHVNEYFHFYISFF